jgi:hypothetical protein
MMVPSMMMDFPHPALAQRRKRFHTLFHLPKDGERSRHGVPVRAIRMIASTNSRLLVGTVVDNFQESLPSARARRRCASSRRVFAATPALDLTPSLSCTPPTTFRILIGTRIDSADFLHKHLQPRLGRLAMSDIPQCPCPLADCFIIGKISARAAYNCSKWVRIPVEGQLRKFESMSQKLLGPSPPCNE